MVSNRFHFDVNFCFLWEQFTMIKTHNKKPYFNFKRPPLKTTTAFFVNLKDIELKPESERNPVTRIFKCWLIVTDNPVVRGVDINQPKLRIELQKQSGRQFVPKKEVSSGIKWFNISCHYRIARLHLIFKFNISLNLCISTFVNGFAPNSISHIRPEPEHKITIAHLRFINKIERQFNIW